MDTLELWGGHECTVNRVGSVFHDQTRLSGHHDRIEDLDRFASLGVSRLRYPVLWERVAPSHPDDFDFGWSDARIARLGQLGVSPIVGLLHHGSGPAYTQLLDPDFPAALAGFARRTAERYPEVGDWIPVNEPLTTARFSCLYGHWYPHAAEEGAFWRALLNQVAAVGLSMKAIRAVNPDARLIQTEDFGKTYATAAVQYQADYDNTRRWMTWDLLFGRVTSEHPMWERLCSYGLGDQLRALADAPSPPDVLGVNHYLTSERFLDHRCDRYPEMLRGGNQRMAYADVEAVRVMQPGPLGLEGVLREVCETYGRPVAITECHNGCTREEQMRWIVEAWDTALRLREEGLPIKALTAWSLLGAYDWDSLLTQPRGSYEPGVFDLRGCQPRETALAGLLRALASSASKRPVGSGGAGWWRRDIRLEYPPTTPERPPQPRKSWRTPSSSPPLLITGATGTLGKALARGCELRGLDYVLTSRAQLDLAAPETFAPALARHRPWAVLNAAGWVRVDDAEHDPAACNAANAEGAVRLAQACSAAQVAFVGFSSDLVFDGTADEPYTERDRARPLNAYGASKAAAEEGVLRETRALMIRTSAFFSPNDQHNFAVQSLQRLAEGLEVAAADDLIVSPTYVPDLVRATLDLLIDGERGLWHLANEGETSWADLARRLAHAYGYDANAVRGAPSMSFGWPAARPRYAALTSARGRIMPPLEDALSRFAAAWASGAT